MKKQIFLKLASILFMLSLMTTSFSFAEDFNLKEEKCSNIHCVRDHIDNLNSEILKLLALRMKYVIQAGDIKINSNIKTATDQKRADAVVDQVKKKAKENGLPEEYVEKIFKIIVTDSTELEQKYIDKKLNK